MADGREEREEQEKRREEERRRDLEDRFDRVPIDPRGSRSATSRKLTDGNNGFGAPVHRPIRTKAPQ